MKVIFNNIISNAIYYHDLKNNPFVEIHLSRDVDSLIISIEDNGSGIKKEYLPKIFDMFYRGTSDSEGSGLGLYIVKGILKKLNGSIAVESEIGKGSKFTIRLNKKIL
jgi:signal transduction histidine kinase